MNAPFSTPSATELEFDARLAALIDSHTKQLITDAYSFGLCSEDMAISLIRDNNLVNA
jgi:hypothetical protein